MSKPRIMKRTFEEAIKLICHHKGGELVRAGKVNQSELGRLAKTSQPNISRWIKGEVIPTVESITPLARALGVTVSQLLGQEPIPGIDQAAEDLSEDEKELIAMFRRKNEKGRELILGVAESAPEYLEQDKPVQK